MNYRIKFNKNMKTQSRNKIYEIFVYSGAEMNGFNFFPWCIWLLWWRHIRQCVVVFIWGTPDFVVWKKEKYLRFHLTVVALEVSVTCIYQAFTQFVHPHDFFWLVSAKKQIILPFLSTRCPVILWTVVQTIIAMQWLLFLFLS